MEIGTKTSNRSGRWRIARWRIWVQLAFLAAWVNPWLRMHSLCGPVFHCYSCPWASVACPIGILANCSAVHVLPLAALGILLVVGGLVGSLVCGWVCPFGLLQDLLARIPTPKLELPPWLGYTRYAVLVGLVGVVPYLWGEAHWLFFCRLCPAGAIEGAGPNVVSAALSGNTIPWPSGLKIGIVTTLLIGAVFVSRPWCTLFCPLGAIYGLLNRVSLVYVRFRAEDCNDCNLCHKQCRYRGRSSQRADESRCIRCLDCHRCDALQFTTVLADLKTVPKDADAGCPR